MRVLFVEDDENNAKIVEKMLQSVGHDCDRALLGEQAVSLAQDRVYDFILLDVLLPDIDGYEVLKRLRNLGIRIPYLIQSGLVDRDSSFAGLAFGTGEYLVKPFSQQELITSMESVVARAKLVASQGVDDFGLEALPKGEEVGDSAQRSGRRFKTVKAAKIDYGTGINCRVTDLSHGGAALRLPEDDLDVPPTFFLELKSGEQYHCRVCWREQDKIGVKFLGPVS